VSIDLDRLLLQTFSLHCRMRSDPRALPGNEQFCSCRAFIIALKTGCKPETAKPTATPWVKIEESMQAVSLRQKNAIELKRNILWQRLMIF
jgi:hypothetical protein